MRGPVSRAQELRKAGTIAEYRLWYALRNRALAGHKFVRQFKIGRYIVDFACREAALVIEVDGSQHAASEKDATRDAFLRAQGYSILRFWNNEVLENRQGVLTAIVGVLDGTPSPDLRYAPADLSPTGRGKRGERAASSARQSALAATHSPIPLPVGERSVAQQPGEGAFTRLP